MFTLTQIQEAHSKVKSGADFPNYTREIIRLGVARFETFVHDNHTDYYSKVGLQASSPPDPELLNVYAIARYAEFLRLLKSHQQGQTDFSAFRKDCASTGIHRWIVDLEDLTCTYYDQSGRTVLIEQISV